MGILNKESGILIKGIFAVLLLQSCNVYHTRTSTLEEAAQSHQRIKIVSDQVETYEFRWVEKNEDKFYGLARKNSDTARKLLGHSAIQAGNFLKFELDETRIYGIYLKDYRMSNVVNVGVPVLSAVGLIGLTDKDFRPRLN